MYIYTINLSGPFTKIYYFLFKMECTCILETIFNLSLKRKPNCPHYEKAARRYFYKDSSFSWNTDFLPISYIIHSPLECVCLMNFRFVASNCPQAPVQTDFNYPKVPILN